MGQANQAKAQEWHDRTGLQSHLNSGPHELCNRKSDSVWLRRLAPKG